MKKLKTLRIVRLDLWKDREADEQPADACPDDASYPNGLDPSPRPEPDEPGDATCPDDPSDPDTETGNPPLQLGRGETLRKAVLLLNEADEINNWARLGCQLCFGVFTLLLTVNGIAIVWFATSNRAFVFFLFMIINLMGTLATVFVGKYLLGCDRRLRELMWMLTNHPETEDPWSWPQSPIPRQAVKILFGLIIFALIMLLGFWTVLFVVAS